MNLSTKLHRFAVNTAFLTTFGLASLGAMQDADAQLSASGRIVKNETTGKSHFNELKENDKLSEVFDKLASNESQITFKENTIVIGGHGIEKGFALRNGTLADKGGFQLADGTFIDAWELGRRLLEQKDADGNWLFTDTDCIFLIVCQVGRLACEDAFGQQLAKALDAGLKQRSEDGAFTGWVLAANGLLIGNVSDRDAEVLSADGDIIHARAKSIFGVSDKMFIEKNGEIRYETMLPLFVQTEYGSRINHQAFTAYFADKPPVGGAILRPHPRHKAPPAPANIILEQTAINIPEAERARVFRPQTQRVAENQIETRIY